MKILSQLKNKVKKSYLLARYKGINKKYKIHIADTLETLEEIANDKSIIRFGDGEFLLINGRGITFQKEDSLLARRLREILFANEASSNQLIAIPYEMRNLEGYTEESKLFWMCYVKDNHSTIYPLINSERKYYDSQVTRIYINRENKNDFEKYLACWKEIWKGKDLLMVEGEKTRFGVGNDLFDNVNSIKRILGPSENAFEFYDEILEKVSIEASNRLVIAALGPTATVLAYDLSKKGIRCLDMGNLDMEYEWFRKGVTSRCKIEGKYSFEMDNGTNVEDVEDSSYMEQIIGRIGC